LSNDLVSVHSGGIGRSPTYGVLEHDFVAGFTGEVANPVVHEYTDDGHRELPAEGPQTPTRR
jgi:hypothetical protein